MNLGWPELLLITVIALLLFGAKRLPELAKSVGATIRAIKDGIKDEPPGPGSGPPNPGSGPPNGPEKP